MGCGNRMTVTFYFCPNCLKEYTVTGTMPQPEWMRFMINDYQSFHNKKATTHEVPFSFLQGDDLIRVESMLEIEIDSEK